MVELPLLFENKLQNNFSCTISLYAPKPVILKRLQARGLSDRNLNAASPANYLCTKKWNKQILYYGVGGFAFFNQQAEQFDPAYFINL